MITDAMVEAGCTKYLDLMVEATGNEDEVVAPEFMRAAIEAAIAVQPVPTDAEIEKAIDRLEVATIEWARSNESARTTVSTGPRGDKTVELHDALLRLIAAQWSAARREALEAVKSELRSRIENYPQFDESGRLNALYPGNDIACKMMIRHIDTMLAKEAG